MSIPALSDRALLRSSRRHAGMHAAWALALALVTALAPAAAAAQGDGARKPAPERRLALVVGNARYAGAPLNNPENDARVVASTLRRLGFEVAEHVNLPMREFRRVLREFSRRVQHEEGVALFYYAGHGVQIEGRNYLIPVDLNPRDEDEVKDDAVDIDDLFVSRLERAKTPVRIVILDACRDNPFATRSRSQRGAGGLAEMGARGTLVAFASAPGATAEDGPAGTNSVYTRHLVHEMLAEGVEIEQMFKNVRVKVLRDTQQRQVPWVNTSLTANFSFRPRTGGAGDDAPARREELARLQGLLEQRDLDQRRLEQQLRQLRDQLGQSAPAAAAGTAPAPGPAVPNPSPLASPPAPAASPPTSAAPNDAATAMQPGPMAGSRRPDPAPASATPTATPPAQPAPPAPRARPPASAPAVAQTGAERTGPQPTAGRRDRASGGARSERCVALLIRAQLGEPMPAAEMAYLQKECK
jgi:hypothetical protein